MFWDREKYIKQNHYFEKDNCPFCNEDQLILNSTKHWYIMYNKFPYYWNKVHLMAIPKRHLKFTIELNNEELIDFNNVEIFMNKYYKWEKNYFSFIRQSLWWRSVEHLHYHYLPWHISFQKEKWNNILKIKNK